MRTSLKIENNLGYTGNSDAKSRRDRALSNIIMTVSSIVAKAATGDSYIHKTEYQMQDAPLMDFLRGEQRLFSEMSYADKTAFHIREVRNQFVLRINVTRDKKTAYRLELKFGAKNELGDKQFTGFHRIV